MAGSSLLMARGDPDPVGSGPLVVTGTSSPEDVIARLVDATMPLFLESGRIIGPVFRTREDLALPKSERGAEFVEHLRRDAILIYET